MLSVSALPNGLGSQATSMTCRCSASSIAGKFSGTKCTSRGEIPCSTSTELISSVLMLLSAMHLRNCGP